MKVTLLNYTANPEVTIGQAAAICYDADTSEPASRKRAIKCRDSGHLSTMRFAWASVNITGISRICSHQLVRMAHAGILQKSQRFVSSSNAKFIQPPALRNASPELQARWNAIEAECLAIYDLAITEGMHKEDARYVLLHSADTEVNLSLNFQGWKDMLGNRTAKAAQWEIREVALEIERLLNGIAPNLFPLSIRALPPQPTTSTTLPGS